ncbi:MFS transporter [Mucilaginibacter sp. Bleaf8]|uniref:MFS transporter n=1 Tax=Mucilaginibacter sp. Bleaf8 TaxID=2834430 RepID=UPI001BCFC178|nr:MFS transporter [Mucilaginibacter sp. Bleaf8]MBS7566581.1 MFS transporter [Mucilaginibacter sp. Bleaf8]
MNLRPSEILTEQQVQSGQKYILKDSLAGEAMVNLSGGAFITAMALHLGASNFQIGLLASLPILTNIFQLFSIWLVQRYNNRRAVAVVGSFLGRFPMLFAAFLPFMFSTAMGLKLLLVILFAHYFFGSIAGASWNAWVKDLIPENGLGAFFSHRTRLVTILSAVLSLFVSFTIDYVKAHYIDHLTLTYYAIFVLGGIIGLVGVIWLSRAPEPMPIPVKENVFAQFKKPLGDKNFRNLLKFNAAWAFALNLAVPFFTVFIMKTIGLSLSYVIGFTMLAQASNILTIKKVGRLTDRYSNKTLIHICAPVYIVCILAWTYAAMPESKLYSVLILAVISVVSGVATGGIALALNNIGMKLAPRREAMAYMSSLNMVVAFFSAISPIIGGLLADFFATYQLVWDFQWKDAAGVETFQLINLHSWSFLFIIGGMMAFVSLRLLNKVKEQGEVQKDRVMLYMQARLRKQIRQNSHTLKGGVLKPVQKVQTLMRQAS